MSSTQYTAPLPGRSAPVLVWGLVLVFVGQALYGVGQDAALRDALDAATSLYGRPSGAGTPQMLIGGILSLVGLVLALVGVHRLATRIDRLVLGQ